MANDEHLKILRQGPDVWNEWRLRYSKVIPDLRGAALNNAILNRTNLSDVDLSDAALHRANLNNSNLRGANLSRAFLGEARLSHSALHNATLSEADLSHAYMIEANLLDANLSGAKLIGASLSSTVFSRANLGGAKLNNAHLNYADLTGTDLGRADLSQARLFGANLTDANLADTNLTEVITDRTIFCNIDLSETRGLNEVNHYGPSEVSISTIFSSQGKIPEPFLRGCGVPESFIVQIPALVAALQPIQFYSCFISYSSKDDEFAQRLYADLQSRGVRCWFAPEDLKTGERFRRRIDEVIRVHAGCCSSSPNTPSQAHGWRRK